MLRARVVAKSGCREDTNPERDVCVLVAEVHQGGLLCVGASILLPLLFLSPVLRFGRACKCASGTILNGFEEGFVSKMIWRLFRSRRPVFCRTDEGRA